MDCMRVAQVGLQKYLYTQCSGAIKGFSALGKDSIGLLPNSLSHLEIESLQYIFLITFSLFYFKVLQPGQKSHFKAKLNFLPFILTFLKPGCKILLQNIPKYNSKFRF